MSRDSDAYRMYAEFAPWWPLLSAPEDYAEEAALYMEVILEHAARPVATVLELGSGGGNNASHMRSRFEMTLVDLSQEMLAVSRELNPECEHHHGDMRSFRLDRRFDAVVIHDAIDYMVTTEDLGAAFATAATHLESGGVLLVCPDYVAENFAAQTDHGGHDSADGARGMRYLEWDTDPDPDDEAYTTDYVYLLRDGSDVEVAHDRHISGLFPQAVWIELMTAAGFRDVEAVPLQGSDWSTMGFCGVA